MKKVQKRALGIVSGLQGTYHQRLKELNILSLEDRRRLSDLVKVFKIVHGIDKVDLTPGSPWSETTQSGPQGPLVMH